MARQFEEGRKASTREGAELLRELLEALGTGGSDDELRDVGVRALSTMSGVQQEGTSEEVLVSELLADGRRPEAMNELLRRLVARSAEDRFRDPAEALEALSAFEEAVAREEATRQPASQDASPPTTPEAAPAGPEAERRQRRIAAWGLGLIVALALGLLMLRLVTASREAQTPTFTSELSGTTVEVWGAAELEQRGDRIEWADACTSVSSLGGHHCMAYYTPDVFPENERSGYAWYPLGPDDGTEWIQLEWNTDVRVRAVVVVESFNPGAVVAVDDLVDAHRPTLTEGERVRLWSGATEPSSEPRVLLFRLAEPRYMRNVRLVLDTARVPGFNEIDTVGLLPE